MNTIEEIIEAIHFFLETNASCSEHELILHLKSKSIEPFDQLNLKDNKDLFSAHFLTRHALYTLQNRYLEEKSLILKLGLTRIDSSPFSPGQAELTEHDSVKAYYLDMEHYLEKSEDEVDSLLSQFWAKYLAFNTKNEDLEILGLADGASYAEIKKQYRSLIQQHHPDKGGDASYFIKLKQAKENLDRHFK